MPARDDAELGEGREGVDSDGLVGCTSREQWEVRVWSREPGAGERGWAERRDERYSSGGAGGVGGAHHEYYAGLRRDRKEQMSVG